VFVILSTNILFPNGGEERYGMVQSVQRLQLAEAPEPGVHLNTSIKWPEGVVVDHPKR